MFHVSSIIHAWLIIFFSRHSAQTMCTPFGVRRCGDCDKKWMMMTRRWQNAMNDSNFISLLFLFRFVLSLSVSPFFFVSPFLFIRFDFISIMCQLKVNLIVFIEFPEWYFSVALSRSLSKIENVVSLNGRWHDWMSSTHERRVSYDTKSMVKIGCRRFLSACNFGSAEKTLIRSETIQAADATANVDKMKIYLWISMDLYLRLTHRRPIRYSHLNACVWAPQREKLESFWAFLASGDIRRFNSLFRSVRFHC